MLREAKGWTQKQLAEKCGMRQSRISALEDPNYENFEAATLRRLASAFDVALTIRFIPFSELTGWTATLSSEKLTPKDFAQDSLSPETSAPYSGLGAPAQLSNTKIFLAGLPPLPTRAAQTSNVLSFPAATATTSRREAA
jgi:transcriptional regulator with XRE-family HTH domain